MITFFRMAVFKQEIIIYARIIVGSNLIDKTI